MLKTDIKKLVVYSNIVVFITNNEEDIVEILVISDLKTIKCII